MPPSEFSGNFFFCQVTLVQTDQRPLNLVSPMNICLRVNTSNKKKEPLVLYINYIIEIMSTFCILEQSLKNVIFGEKHFSSDMYSVC